MNTLQSTSSGAVVIDKPAGWTSHDVVARVRRLLHQRSVGHIGTLDPLATGVLPLLFGDLTRLAQFFLHAEKEYTATIRFGFATTTYDSEGEPVGLTSDCGPSRTEIEAALARFRGNIFQLPPAFSAKKIAGQRAYAMARAQKPVTLTPIAVEIHSLELLRYEEPFLQVHLHCSSGTYVRSIAHELGQALRVGAHITQLRRERAGNFTLSHSCTLEQLAELGQNDKLDSIFFPERLLLNQFPAVIPPEDILRRMVQGQRVNLPDFSCAPFVRVFNGQEQIVAIGQRLSGSMFHPKLVLRKSTTGAQVGLK